MISVLLPVWNGASHLDAALGSLVEQSLDEVEILVVDDGSDDATPSILGAWADREPRIRVYRQHRSGIVAALERARTVARGRFLARMDADDVAAPDRLERQLDFLQARPGLAGCGSLVEYVPREELGRGAHRYERWINSLVEPDDIEREIFVECPLPHPTFFFRAEVLGAVGGYRDRGWPEDYDLVLRLWSAGHRVGKVPEVLLWWREGPDRLSRVHEAYSPGAFRRCKVHFLRRTLLAGRPGAVVWGAGPTGKAFGRELLRQGVRVLGWVDVDPRKIGQDIHGAPVVAHGDAGRFVGALHLGAVGQSGARREVRAVAEELGLVEARSFVAVA